jgi:hypothetical protein
VTIRNYRLPAVLWAGLMLGVMLLLSVGPARRILRSSSNLHSANFAMTEFSEVQSTLG